MNRIRNTDVIVYARPWWPARLARWIRRAPQNPQRPVIVQMRGVR